MVAIRTGKRQPGYTLVAPSISGSNVAAQQVSNTFEPKTSAPSQIGYAAIPDSFSASTSIYLQPHRSLSPSEIARTRCAVQRRISLARSFNPGSMLGGVWPELSGELQRSQQRILLGDRGIF